jgi:hypothetical protein
MSDVTECFCPPLPAITREIEHRAKAINYLECKGKEGVPPSFFKDLYYRSALKDRHACEVARHVLLVTGYLETSRPYEDSPHIKVARDRMKVSWVRMHAKRASPQEILRSCPELVGHLDDQEACEAAFLTLANKLPWPV